MNDWRASKARADQYLPEAKRIIRHVLPDLIRVDIAPPHEDRLNATDLIVDNVRAWPWRHRFEDCTFRDFTVRYFLPNGAKTECEKLLEGHGDYYLYSWTDKYHAPNRQFSEWAVIDLDRWRDQWETLEIEAMMERNPGFDSAFLAWPISLLEERGVVARAKMVQPSLFTR